MFYIVLFVTFLLLAVPLAFTIGGISSIAIIVEEIPIQSISQWMFAGLDSFTLIAVPLFILAGEIMSKGGLTRRLIDFANAVVGHLPSGLAIVSVFASMLFAAITGSAVAAAAAVGGIMLPVMKKEGYSLQFSASLVACAGTIGPIIPPSISLLLYGNSASVSISDLFIAGIIPGILMTVVLIVTSYYIGKKNNYRGRDKRASIKEMIVKGRHAVLALLTPIIIIGGILSGVFTATESAGIAVLYALVIGLFVYRELRLTDLLDTLLSSARLTGQILIIVSAAALLTKLITTKQIPQLISSFLIDFADNTVVLLLLINVILLIAGTFIDTVSAVVLFTPIFLPTIQQFGIDPIHFGVLLNVNLTIGMITPPLGVCLFVTSSISNISVKSMIMTRYLWIFMGSLLIVLLLVTFIPSLSLFLVELIK